MLFTNCLNPKFVYNKYTGHEEYVPCGKCVACDNLAASIKSDYLSHVIKRYKYSFMFTLTYDNTWLPRWKYIFDKRGCLQVVPIGRVADDYRYQPLYNNSTSYDNIDYNINFETRLEVENDLACNYGTFGVVSRKDCQKFIKRFRQNLIKSLKKIGKYDKETASFCYYLASEYGPKTYRPHYHGLISFDSAELLSVVPNCIVQSWGLHTRNPRDPKQFVFRPYALTDLTYSNIKLCDANTSKYIADYVAGNLDLPKVLRARALRPFALHSSHTHFHAGEDFTKKMLEDVRRGVITYRKQWVDGDGCVQCVDVQYPTYSLGSVFRKAKGHRNLSSAQAVELYGFSCKYYKEYIDYVTPHYSAVRNDYKSLDSFCRANSFYSLRCYLFRSHRDEYISLGMLDDAVWYACRNTLRVWQRFGRCFAVSDIYLFVDEYVRTLNYVDTLRFVRKFGNFCDTFNKLYDSIGPMCVFAAYPMLYKVMPLHRYSGEVMPPQYSLLLHQYGIFEKCYKGDLLNVDYISRYSEFNLASWSEHVDVQLQRYSDRNKSKKLNNSIINGIRLIQ